MRVLAVEIPGHSYLIEAMTEGHSLELPKIGEVLGVPDCLKAQGVTGVLVLGVRKGTRSGEDIGEIDGMPVGEG
jgi:hypothetical protein